MIPEQWWNSTIKIFGNFHRSVRKLGTEGQRDRGTRGRYAIGDSRFTIHVSRIFASLRALWLFKPLLDRQLRLVCLGITNQLN